MAEPDYELVPVEHDPFSAIPHAAGLQLAMADQDKQNSPIGGMIPGGEAGGGGFLPMRAPLQGEVMPPPRLPIKSEAAQRLGVPNWADIHGGLRASNNMTVSERVQRDSLGIMWKALEERGVSYEQIMKMNPVDAYQWLKARNIGGGR